MEKPTVCNEELNKKEEYEGSQMDVSICFSKSDFFCQKEICLLDPVEEQSDISFEIQKKMK